jgi:hypothetical protein
MTSRLKKAPTGNQTFEWLEDDLNPSWSNPTANASAPATGTSANLAVTAGTGPYFNRYDIVKNSRSGEIMLVVRTSTSDITAVRGWDGTAATTSTTDDLVILGSAFQEGSTSGMLITKSTQTTRAFNYVQIFRKSVELSQSLAASNLYGGSDRDYQRKKKGIEMMRDIERTFLFNNRYQAQYADAALAGAAVATATRRSTGGLWHYRTNMQSRDMSGLMTETEFEAFLRDLFLYGENSRVMFCSPLVLSVISLWAQPKLQMLPKDKTYGIAINQYLSPQGTINLVRNMLLEESTYQGYSWALQMSELTYRYLNGRDIKFETEIQHPGDDTFKDQYIGEVGLELHQESLHGYIYNVTS